ncbi:MAG: PKD domain-containing protein [Acidobacteriota bacterium]
MRRSSASVCGCGVGLATLLLASNLVAQCVTPAGVYFDEFVPGGDNRDGTGFPRMFPQVSASFNGRANVFAGVGKRVHVYDPTNPVKPTLLIDAGLWTGGTVYLHNEYPLQHIAVRSGYPYGIASYTSEGWVLFRITWDATGKVTALTNIAQFTFPSGSGSPDTWMWRAQLFQVGGRYYAVGRYLGPAGQQTADMTIVDLGDGTGTPPLTRVAVISNVPTAAQYFDTVQDGSSWYLYVFGSGFGYSQGALFIYNISTPSAPSLVATIDGATVPGVAFDIIGGGLSTERTAIVETGGRKRMYTIPVRPAGNRRVYAFDIANPVSPQAIGSVELADTGFTEAIASDGELLAVSLAKDPGKARARYFGVGNDTFSAIGDGPLWNSADPPYPYELTTDVALTLVGSKYRALRGAKIRAYWDTIETSCLSTTPNPGITITRFTTRGTPTCTGGTGIEARGFPGDTFTLTNTSSGSYTFEKTEVLRSGLAVATYTNPAASWSWTSPTTETGEYEVKITVRDSGGLPYQASKKLYLCEDPKGVAKVTAVNGTPCTSCSWLQGQTLTMSLADSEGSPDFPSSSWTYEFREPGGANWEPLNPPPNGQTASLPLSSLGDYRVTALVIYPFGHQSTTSPLVLHSGQVTGVLKMFQGAEVSRGGTVLASTGLELRWEGALASGQTATCTWKILNSSQAEIWNESGACSPPATRNHPGLATTGAYTARLQVVSSGGDSFTDEFPFNVSSCTPPGAASNPNPANGATNVPAGNQTLTWSSPASGTGPFTYTVYGPLGPLGGCENLSTTACTTSTSFPSGSFRWKVRVSNSCGVNDPSSFWEYTIGSTCTQPSAPALSSPANGATVSAGAVTFSWSASSGTTPITYDVQVTAGGIGAGGCSTTGTSCSVNLTAAATYSWTVRASNSCGSATSASRTFTIGSACTAPSAPVPVSPASGASVNAGAITFTWTASSGTAPINYAVQLKAGPIGVGGCSSSSTSCSASLTTPGNYTWQVTASNACGAPSSAAIPFTVSSPCGALGAPTLTSPANAATVSGTAVTLQWAAPSQGQAPFTYDVFVDGAIRASNLTTLQSSVSGLSEGNHTWFVRAKDSCGQSTDSATRTFTFSLCAVSAPQPDFDWSPKGPDPYFPTQQQPYAGQEVTLSYTGLGGPPEYYRWYDFHQTPPKVVEGTNLSQVKHTWTSVSGTSYQDMNVRLKVSNCAGSPAELLKPVRVYRDTRPVLAVFGTVGSLVAGSPSTFRAETGPAVGDPTEFDWDFGDGNTLKGTSSQVQHTYACGRTYEVKLTTRRGSTTSTATVKPVVVGGRPCAPLALVVPDVAVNLQSPFALWQSRVRLFNPGTAPMTTSIMARTRDNKVFTGNLTIGGGEAATLDDIIMHLTPVLTNTVVTMWFTAQEGERLPLIGARTFTEPAGGGTYGQAVPVYYLWQPESVPTTLWVEGAEHDGLQTGFRTNLTVINPSPSSWGSKGITLTLFSEYGQTYSKRLTGFGARQYNRYNPITALFGLEDGADLGAITLKVEVDAGVLALVGCSVNDNRTNDSFFLLAQPDVD